MSETDHDTPNEDAGPAPETGEAADSATAPGSTDDGSAEHDPARHIAALETELAQTRDQLLRAAAEMDNLRKRTQREKEDATRFAITRFARDIVTVSDDLARALDAVPADARSGSGEASILVTGIEMTERQLQQVFERHGVRRFDPTGEKFDPAVHEAMFEMPDPSRPAGTIAQVVEAGYMIGERVLRPARVGVSSGPGTAAAPPEPAPQTSAVSEGEQIGIKIDRTA